MRVVAFALLLLGIDAYAQAPFRKNLVTSLDVLATSLDGVPTGCFQTLDGGIVILGSTNSCGAGGYDMLLFKIDVDGDTIWGKTYGSALDEYSTGLVNTPDSGYLVVGVVDGWPFPSSSTFAIKVNSVGNVVWERSYAPINAYGVIATNDGGFALTGRTANQPPVFDMGASLVKLNSTGGVEWSRSFAAYAQDVIPFSLIGTDDGGYLISGMVWHYDDNNDYATLIRTDSAGNMLWTRTYRSTNNNGHNKMWFTDVVRSNGGSYYLSGNYYVDASSSCPLLMKVDLDGELIWSKAYTGYNENYVSSILELSNSDLLVSGFEGTLFRTDSTGNIELSWSYDRFFGLSINRSDGGGFLLSGTDFAYHSQISVALADSAGNIDCVQSGSPILVIDSIAELVAEIIVPQAPPISSSVPSIATGWCSGTMVECGSVGIPVLNSDVDGAWVSNPVVDQLAIGGTINGGRAVVYDLTGKELMSAATRSSETLMDATDLSPGLYIVQYRYGDQMKTLKFFKH
ncbi:MAG TPA: T9SS type A sorting domain-containing protein [Flavobacteriales bacterium]|nr:T9SS type A sorting domain-containing protein [Flavobacteriales bacterium]